MSLNLVLLQANASSQFMSQMILIAGIMVIFYFFMILPQQRKQKEQKKFRDSLKVGDSVITIGGMHGKIHTIDDETVTLLVDKSTKLVFDKHSISPEASKRIAQ